MEAGGEAGVYGGGWGGLGWFVEVSRGGVLRWKIEALCAWVWVRGELCEWTWLVANGYGYVWGGDVEVRE